MTPGRVVDLAEETWRRAVSSPQLRRRALRAVRQGRKVSLERRVQPGTGAVVETLLVEEPGGTAAGQAIGGGTAAFGWWNAGRGALEVGTSLAAYGLDGVVAYGDENAWLSRAGACHQVRLLLSEPEAAFVVWFLGQYGWLLVGGSAGRPRHAVELVDVRVLGVPVELGAVSGVLECLASAARDQGGAAAGAGGLLRRLVAALGACPERKLTARLRQVVDAAVAAGRVQR